MPNIHSTELLLILVVALLVIGPERLPAAIRTVSLWMGRFRRSFYKVKAEIERELNADEVRRQLHNESVLSDLRDAKSDVQSVASGARQAVAGVDASVNRIVNSKNFDPGASAATSEQLRAAAAEREAAVTGATPEAESATASEAAAQAGTEPETKANAAQEPNGAKQPTGETQPTTDDSAARPDGEAAK